MAKEWHFRFKGHDTQRTEIGKSCGAASFNSDTTTVPVTEALALRNSLMYAKERAFSKIEVEGDSRLAINVGDGVSTPPQGVYTKDQGFSKIEVEGDTKLVINAGNGVSTPPPPRVEVTQTNS
ncbi:hypothetical protein ACLB2K_074964 [Fragaria x ananassa]